MTGDVAQAYESLVEELVLDALTRGATRFDNLLAALPGVYPTVVFDTLTRMASANKISKKVLADAAYFVSQKHLLEYAVTRSSSPSRRRVVHRIALPIQHPLDYEWRFGEGAINRLLGDGEMLTAPGETLLMLGTPTLLRGAIERDYPRSLILLDANKTVVECLTAIAPNASVIQCNVAEDPLPEITTATVAAVIIDPPWYEEYIRSFLWAACRLAPVGAHILLSLPPLGTRPGIAAEVRNIMDWAQSKMGLKLLTEERAALPYLTPPFERNALRAAGIYNVPDEWRRGDLAVFTVTKMGLLTPRPKLPATPPMVDGQAGWNEVTLFGTRIRIRRKSSEQIGFDDPSLVSLVPGEVLPTVSRRDARRQLVDVWTSGNRVYSCRGTQVLDLIMRAIAAEHDPAYEVACWLGRELSFNEDYLISHASNQILDVARREQSERALDEGNNP